MFVSGSEEEPNEPREAAAPPALNPESGFRKPPVRRLGVPGHRLLWPSCWAGRPRAAAAQQAPENGELATATRLPEGRGQEEVRCTDRSAHVGGRGQPASPVLLLSMRTHACRRETAAGPGGGWVRPHPGTPGALRSCPALLGLPQGCRSRACPRPRLSPSDRRGCAWSPAPPCTERGPAQRDGVTRSFEVPGL